MLFIGDAIFPGANDWPAKELGLDTVRVRTLAVIAAIVVLFIEPLLLFVGAFLLFRFGSNILGPLGARIVDQAIAQKG